MCQVMQYYETIARKEGEESTRMEILKNMVESGINFDVAVKLANIPMDKCLEYRRKINC